MTRCARLKYISTRSRSSHRPLRNCSPVVPCTALASASNSPGARVSSQTGTFRSLSFLPAQQGRWPGSQPPAKGSCRLPKGQATLTSLCSCQARYSKVLAASRAPTRSVERCCTPGSEAAGRLGARPGKAIGGSPGRWTGTEMLKPSMSSFGVRWSKSRCQSSFHSMPPAMWRAFLFAITRKPASATFKVVIFTSETELWAPPDLAIVSFWSNSYHMCCRKDMLSLSSSKRTSERRVYCR
mmetsp:Transcript_56788/g.182457  ORF Transcript_56788/g.182457 Transcript_56788/m.182457 type:complete len:240 (-) Transcript_56788:201-920(-)